VQSGRVSRLRRSEIPFLFPYPGLTAWAKLWRTSGASERAGLEQPFEAPLEARDKQSKLKVRPP
jgi:hypothetical protein